MTLSEIQTSISNGDVPPLLAISALFGGDDAWLIRLSAFGDIHSAIRFCDARHLRWQIGYDNRAVIDLGEDRIIVISVNPAHALICAALQALHVKTQNPDNA